MKYDLIVYDNDGTLVDTEYPVNKAFLDTVHRYNTLEYGYFDVDWIIRECIGTTVQGIFDRMAQDVQKPLPQDTVDRIILEYQDVVPIALQEYLKPDNEQISILQDLSTRFRQCVASNGRTRNVVNSIAAAGLSHIFPENHIFTAENKEVKRPKPYPDLILFAARQMGITDMSRVIHLEDAKRGARAGLDAGACVVGYTGLSQDKEATRKELHEEGVVTIVDSWQEFQEFVLR